MTWLWVKKRRGRTIFLFLTFLLTIIHNTSAETTTTTTTTTTTGGGGGGGGTLNSSDYTPYLDLTNFVDGVNNWNFMGVWAKYDLNEFTEDTLPVPLVLPDGEDQGVFICQTSTIPSTLLKEFPPLHNATFSLTYYAKASGGELYMTGEVVGAEEITEALFNYSLPDDGTGHVEGTWGTDTFPLPNLAAQGNFKIRVGILHSDSGVWAAAEMRVEGVTGPPIATTPAPPPIIPQNNQTTVESKLNETETTTPKQVNGTAVVPVSTTTTTTTTEGDNEEELSRLESVAQAVWDAFYVFLALFCACMVALVALIVHGRCKDDEPPPAVATYNPRTASYRMDKVYDNPSYDNNAV